MLADTMTADEARSLFDYDLLTGVFTWKPRHGWGPSKKWAGTIAGSINSEGYRNISIRGRMHKAHRLAWLLVFGEMPSCEIDHINGDTQDNRIANLRLATRTENARNKGANRASATGVKGVSFRADKGKFFARIKIGGISKHLGYFSTVDLAAAAYNEEAAKLFGEFARCAQ